jgi:AAA domain
VGSLIIAAEGFATIQNRVAMARMKLTEAPKLPVAWRRAPENLKGLEVEAKFLDARFREEFGVRLGVIFIDTLAAAFNLKDETANAEASSVARQLLGLAAQTGTVVVPSHHYGKNQETGLRGASAWCAAADVV